MIKIAVSGAAGRMGGRIIDAVQETEGMELSGALERMGHPELGRDAGVVAGYGMTGVSISDNLNDVVKGCDVLVDFTSPKVSLKNLEICGLFGKAAVIGSTGFSAEEQGLARELAKDIPVVIAPNMSVGVNVCFKVLADIAKILGDEFDVEIVEAHHRMKKDAPSGTAVRMGEVVAGALGREYRKVANCHREGIPGERTKEEIGMHAIRGGDIVGDHTVLFAGIGERIEITHKSASRVSYAQGALRSVRFLESRSSGLYDMQDVLGLR